MKLPRTVLLSLVLTPLSFGAEVMESLKTRAGREYVKVEILTNDDVGIRIRHDAGTARIPYEDLPDAMQTKYRNEGKKASVAKIEATKAENERLKLEEEKNKQALLDQATKKPKKPLPAAKPSGASENQPAEGDHEAEKLQAYIADMNARANEAAVQASRLRSQAETERSRTRSVTKTNRATGGAITEVVPDKSGWAKAARYEEQAVALERQVQKAHSLIREARGRHSDLSEGPGSPVEAE
jgi:hypothetical protein